ncbi:SCO family protein [Sporosarcina sp. 6E9]|uniref:SCO family protein n=1 Tax=Sporosarcina sp. 6E9 TaxID=2819235 RepID=UPI001B30EDAA|nr:SCO family protein [Sporosarcina sp. 6E9]
MHKFFRTSFIVLIVLILGACSGNEFKPDHKLKIEPFAFTNQHNEEVSLDDLKGQVWLAQFVFSNCTTVCGPMMVNMANLQDELIKEKVEDYKIVSFTVDPAFDTPEVLQGYLDVFAPSDESKWEMLTGYKQDVISEIAKKSFAQIVVDDPNSDQVTHGTRFALVNQEGLVVKLYNGNDDVPFEDIVKDMKALIKQGA